MHLLSSSVRSHRCGGCEECLSGTVLYNTSSYTGMYLAQGHRPGHRLHSYYCVLSVVQEKRVLSSSRCQCFHNSSVPHWDHTYHWDRDIDRGLVLTLSLAGSKLFIYIYIYIYIYSISIDHCNPSVFQTWECSLVKEELRWTSPLLELWTRDVCPKSAGAKRRAHEGRSFTGSFASLDSLCAWSKIWQTFAPPI